MTDPAQLDALHLLRPWWLLVIPLAIWLHLRLRRAYSGSAQWQAAIAPHLLQHLTVGAWQGKRIRPYQLATLGLVLASLALSGPAWQREITPFTEDRAPLVIALELTPTMLAVDQPPSRLDRAKQKIRDLLARRKGARTAVIGYAGSAHTVLPLTADSALIEVYLESLLPSLMPKEGDDASTALALAEEMLASVPAAGSILFMTDGIDRTLSGPVREHATRSDDQVLVLAFGSEQGGPLRPDTESGSDYGLVAGAAPGLDLTGLSAIAEAAGTSLLRATADQADVDTLTRRIHSHLVNAIQDDEGLQWRDAGYYFLWPLALLILLWSRRGWTIQWV